VCRSATSGGLSLERGDHRFSTGPMLDKVRRQILDADLVLGDITGRNPNVFYELGLADAYGKKTIIITADPAEEAPVDVRHLEFIVYDLSAHEHFLAKLDKATHHVMVERYDRLLARARAVLATFNKEGGFNYKSAGEEQFQATVMRWEADVGLPADDDNRAWAEFLLPKIVHDPSDMQTMKRIDAFLASTSGHQALGAIRT